MGLISGATTAASAGLSFFQTTAANKANQKTARSLINASLTKEAQLRNSRNIEASKTGYQQLRMLGQLRTAMADSGIGTQSNTAKALEQSIYSSFLQDQQAEDDNLFTSILAERLGLQGQLSSIKSAMQSPLLAGITGGLSGLAMGLNIESGIDNYRTRKEGQKKEQEVIDRQRHIQEVTNPYSTQRR